MLYGSLALPKSSQQGSLVTAHFFCHSTLLVFVCYTVILCLQTASACAIKLTQNAILLGCLKTDQTAPLGLCECVLG